MNVFKVRKMTKWAAIYDLLQINDDIQYDSNNNSIFILVLI